MLATRKALRRKSPFALATAESASALIFILKFAISFTRAKRNHDGLNSFVYCEYCKEFSPCITCPPFSASRKSVVSMQSSKKN